jgi:hypothetical protein
MSEMKIGLIIVGTLALLSLILVVWAAMLCGLPCYTGY